MRNLVAGLQLFWSVLLVSGKRIVVVPTPNISHTRYMINIAMSLTALGHETWVCMPQTLADENVFDINGIGIIRYSSRDFNTMEEYMKYVRDSYWRGEGVNLPKLLEILFEHVDLMMHDKKLEKDIADIKPHLMLIDDIPNMHMIAVLAYKYDIPFAFAGSLYDPISYRVPFTPVTFPSALFPYTDRMTFFQRLISFLIHSSEVLIECFSYMDAVARFAPNKPYLPIRELVARAEIVLVESDPILDYPKSSLPNVKLIGGTSISKAKPLKDPFKSFTDEAETDVVLVAFGSYIVNLPEEIAAKLSSALQRLQLNVIWRVNMTSANANNILTSNWVPQNDLLAHPKVKVLVTHCGQSSQYEALYHAVPTLCMPIFLDQHYNAERARAKGFGLTLDLNQATENEIVSHIEEIHTNSTYRTNIQKASKLFRNIYGLPVEKAAFWLDHVLQYGGGHMRAASQTMPGYQFFCLDILAFCLGGIPPFILCVKGIIFGTKKAVLWCSLGGKLLGTNFPGQASWLNQIKREAKFSWSQLKNFACWCHMHMQSINCINCFRAIVQVTSIRAKAKFS